MFLQMFVCQVAAFPALLFTVPRVSGFVITNYLTRFGYLDDTWPREGEDQRDAIRIFQDFSKLPVTGGITEATLRKMLLPRCGVPDLIPSIEFSRRRRRFVLQGSRWKKSRITYRLDDTGKHMNPLMVRTALAVAADMWSRSARISLREVKPWQKADIRVKFALYNHGDGISFDGPGGVIAHAFFPQYGDIHFDDSETFTLFRINPKALDLLQVAIHQFGHALGLSHSDVPDAVMSPFYFNFKSHPELHPDDIRAIQQIYGRKFVLPTRLHSSVPPTKESFTDTAEVSDDKDYEDAIFYQKAGHEDRTRYRGTDNTGSENVGTNIQTADTTKAIPAGTIDY